jgi:very-short-patch-repair endonuclease
MTPVRRQIGPHAARLRRDMTDVEQTLWRALRNRQIANLKFRRQASIGRYVVDFLCIEARLIVELDGGQHSVDGDATRTAVLEAAGYRVLRFWNNEVIESLEGVLETIVMASGSEKKTLTQPSPVRTGEG